MILCWVTHQCPHCLGPEACFLLCSGSQHSTSSCVLEGMGQGNTVAQARDTQFLVSHAIPKIWDGIVSWRLPSNSGKMSGFQNCPGHTVLCLIFKHTLQPVNKENSKSWKTAQITSFCVAQYLVKQQQSHKKAAIQTQSHLPHFSLPCLNIRKLSCWHTFMNLTLKSLC